MPIYLKKKLLRDIDKISIVGYNQIKYKTLSREAEGTGPAKPGNLF